MNIIASVCSQSRDVAHTLGNEIKADIFRIFSRLFVVAADDVITAIAKEKPSYFVRRDNSLADDSVAINFDQIFNTYSPNTERRVI